MNLAKNTGNTIANNSGLAIIGDNANVNIESSSGLKQRILRLLHDQTEISGFLSSLEVYTREKTEAETKGLSGKFSEAGYEMLLDHALDCKEKFVKHLMQNMYSIAYQKILNLLIEEAISTFQYEIYPLIDAGVENSEILNQVNQRVFNKIYDETAVMNCEFNRNHIEGLVFYITGNCFLRWRRFDNLQQS